MFGRIGKKRKEERRLAKRKTKEAKVDARKSRKKSGEGTMYYNMRMPDGSIKKVKAYKSKTKATTKTR